MTPPKDKKKEELREEISKILVKWNMPTRQAAINDIVALFSTHDTALVEEIIKLEKDVINQSNQSGDALSMSHGFNQGLSAAITYIENNRAEIKQK